MNALYLIAEIHPNPEKLETLLSEFQTLVRKTRAEDGCVFYDLVQEEGSDGWLMVEKWESREHWEAHDQSDHVKRIQGQPELFAKDTNLRFMTEIEL